MPKLPNLKDVKNLEGKRVLLRLDLNLPIVSGAVENDFRIQKILPTLAYLKKHQARTIIISHIESAETDSLEKVAGYLNKLVPLTFVKGLYEAKDYVSDLKDGQFMMLENLRLYEGEKQNDDGFAKNLASLADIYVNEAFAVSHRVHASVVAITKYLPSFAGLLFQDEYAHLSKVFNPPRPFFFILGGAKFETKMPLIKKFLNQADTIFVGGALANQFFLAQGLEVGKSVVSAKNFDLSAELQNRKLLLPTDVVVRGEQGVRSKAPQSVVKTDQIFDAGPETIKMLGSLIKKSKFVLWNGPLGDYEKGFRDDTEKLATLIAESSAESVVGGGDTLASIATLNLENKFKFVSTAGGAMLDFLANETLPGIEALLGRI